MKWVMIIRKDLFRYVTFVFGGGLSLILNLIVTFILTEYFKLWYMASFTIALALEMLFLFVYHSVVTFRKRGHVLRFVMVILFISAVNWVFVYFLTEVLDILYLVSIVVAALIVSVVNYFLNKKVVFKVE